MCHKFPQFGSEQLGATEEDSGVEEASAIYNYSGTEKGGGTGGGGALRQQCDTTLVAWPRAAQHTIVMRFLCMFRETCHMFDSICYVLVVHCSGWQHSVVYIVRTCAKRCALCFLDVFILRGLRGLASCQIARCIVYVPGVYPCWLPSIADFCQGCLGVRCDKVSAIAQYVSHMVHQLGE